MDSSDHLIYQIVFSGFLLLFFAVIGYAAAESIREARRRRAQERLIARTGTANVHGRDIKASLYAVGYQMRDALRKVNRDFTQETLRVFNEENHLDDVREAMRTRCASDEEFVSLWNAYHESVTASARAIRERVAKFAEFAPHWSKDESREMTKALTASLLDLYQSVKQTYLDLQGRPDQSVRDYVLGKIPSAGTTVPDLPDSVTAKVCAIYGIADASLAALPPGTDQSVAHILRAARERYVPETLAAYYKARSADPQTALRMLDEQLARIQDGVERNARAAAQNDLTALAANGRFLEQALPA